MRATLTLADLRRHLTVRMAIAPRHLFKRLGDQKSRPHANDQARAELVALITRGWGSLEIDVTGPSMWQSQCDRRSLIEPALVIPRAAQP